jgi:hypothetical protein
MIAVSPRAASSTRPDGKWYAYLFKDNGAVGRIPYLVPVTWKDGWPVLGEDGEVPMTLDIPAGAQGALRRLRHRRLRRIQPPARRPQPAPRLAMESQSRAS